MFKKVVLASSVSLLAACGGGSGGGSNLKTGQVEGLSGAAYRTESQSGFLNSNGEYRYKDGETVTILIGDVELGSRTAGQTTLVELLDLNKLPKNPAEIRGLLRLPEYSRDRMQTRYRKKLSPVTSNNLHIISNKMRLLIALDDDNNPSNGIDISAQQTAVNNLSLDLTSTLYEFAESDSALLFQHTSGISLGMENARPLREAYAMAQLSVEVPQRVRVENGAEYSYDQLSRVVSSSESQTSDSLTTYTYTYSDNGRLNTKTQNTTPFGEGSSYSPFRQVTTNTYTAFGKLATTQSDRYEQGNVTQLESQSFESFSYLDDRVFLTRKQNSADANADGQITYSSSVRQEYNAQLQLTSSKTFDGTNIEDETFDYGNGNFQYDDLNRLTSYEYENTNSNTRQSYQFDYQQVNGNTVTTETITRAASKESTEETINPAGKILKRVVRKLTLQDEITAVATVYYSYNEAGLISECRIEEDTDNDSTLDSTARSALTYSSMGLTSIATTKDTNADNTPDSEVTYNFVYGDHGEFINSTYGTFVYGNNAKDGISYLINEYSTEASEIPADEDQILPSYSDKCEDIFTYGENF